MVPFFFVITIHRVHFSFFFVKPGARMTTYKQIWPPLGTLEAFFIPRAFECGMSSVCFATSETQGRCPFLFVREVDAFQECHLLRRFSE